MSYYCVCLYLLVYCISSTHVPKFRRSINSLFFSSKMIFLHSPFISFRRHESRHFIPNFVSPFHFARLSRRTPKQRIPRNSMVRLGFHSSCIGAMLSWCLPSFPGASNCRNNLKFNIKFSCKLDSNSTQILNTFSWTFKFQSDPRWSNGLILYKEFATLSNKWNCVSSYSCYLDSRECKWNNTEVIIEVAFCRNRQWLLQHAIMMIQ